MHNTHTTYNRHTHTYTYTTRDTRSHNNMNNNMNNKNDKIKRLMSILPILPVILNLILRRPPCPLTLFLSIPRKRKRVESLVELKEVQDLIKKRCRALNEIVYRDPHMLYWEHTCACMNEVAFRDNFRMYRSTFNELLAEIEEPVKGCSLYYGRNRNRRISVDKALAIFLYYISNANFGYRLLSQLFCEPEATMHRAIHDLVHIIIYQMRKKYIVCPLTEEAWREVGSQWLNKHPLNRPIIEWPIAALDGTHIPIIPPSESQSSNKDKWYSQHCRDHTMIMQGFVNHRGIFMDVCVNNAGSTHDSTIWRTHSVIGKALERTQNTALNIPGSHFILADAAYALRPWLLTPYKDKRGGILNDMQILFNRLHSKLRMTVERAFGRLKGRFRILKYVQIHDLAMIGKLTICIVILHNFIESKPEYYERLSETEAKLFAEVRQEERLMRRGVRFQLSEQEERRGQEPSVASLYQQAVKIRDQIAAELYNKYWADPDCREFATRAIQKRRRDDAERQSARKNDKRIRENASRNNGESDIASDSSDDDMSI
jgi:hypothetical protein